MPYTTPSSGSLAPGGAGTDAVSMMLQQQKQQEEMMRHQQTMIMQQQQQQQVQDDYCFIILFSMPSDYASLSVRL